MNYVAIIKCIRTFTAERAFPKSSCSLASVSGNKIHMITIATAQYMTRYDLQKRHS